MNHKQNWNTRDTKCLECGSSVIVEMDGLWSYRICVRNGHVQGHGSSAGPLAGAAMLDSARI